MKNQKFRKLDVWKRSMRFVAEIYRLTSMFPKHEMYGLTTQIRRAAVSIPLNIAEGSGAQSDNEFKRFLIFSLKSSYEVSCGIDIAISLDYLKDVEVTILIKECDEISAMITGLRKSLI